MDSNILQSSSIFTNHAISALGAFTECGGRGRQTSVTVAAMLEQSANAKNSSKTVAKRLKEGRRIAGGGHIPSALRAKRRAHFGQYGGYLSQPAPAAVARRNERERNRVKLVNLGFASLRNQLPDGENNKKMSKVETLRSAVDYIRQLQDLLDENDAVNAVFSPNAAFSPNGAIQPSTSTSSSPARSPIGSASSEPLSADESDLANFQTWFWSDDPE